MAKVLFGMAMSLDGFVNDRNGSVARLYPDMEALHQTEMLQELMQTTGAVVMGRHAYDMAHGDYTGYEFQVPIFVVTHAAPATAPKGQNEKLTFTFVTDGLESAIEKARAAAGDKTVTVIGGANVGQQLIRAGLLDELEVTIVPVLLGEGLRLFEHLGAQPIELERVKLSAEPARTDIRYRVVK